MGNVKSLEFSSTSSDISKINEEFAILSKPFNYEREATIKDYNYEVDALEEEHLKREVHTTKKYEESDPVSYDNQSDDERKRKSNLKVAKDNYSYNTQH